MLSVHSSRPQPHPFPLSSTGPTPYTTTYHKSQRDIEPPFSDKDLELVIAHYNEDLDWLSAFSRNAIIYSKGDSPPLSMPFKDAHVLPNIGRETHTYLTHIVRNYHSLAATTLFLQGNIHDTNAGTPAHTDLTLEEVATQATTVTDSTVLPIGLQLSFSDWDHVQYKEGWMRRRGKTLVRSKRSPAEFWRFIFGSEHPEKVTFVQGACFGVPREAILRRPRSFYENVLRYFEDLAEVNPEEGHFMERFWYAILSDDALVGGRPLGDAPKEV